MDRDAIAAKLIDRNHTSYKKFFDHSWAKDTFDKVRSTRLEKPIDNLIVSWRLTNGAHVLPGITAESLQEFWKGYVQGHPELSESQQQKWFRLLKTKVESRNALNLDEKQLKELRHMIGEVETEVRRAEKIADTILEFDTMKYWNWLASNTEFGFSVVGIQAMCYASLYFAYEDFIANLIRTQDPSYDSHSVNIKIGLSRYFDQDLVNEVWNHDEVRLAREVRNALVHNGACLGPKLERFKNRFVDSSNIARPLIQPHIFNVVDNVIQITPGNSAYLFAQLQERVTRLIDEALKQPGFIG